MATALNVSKAVRRRPVETLVLACLLGGIIWFYHWTARPEPMGATFPAQSDAYYNLLARGFLKGQTAVDHPADPFLATLKNPRDPAQRAGHGLHDMSYYRGNYYLYFGATPALMLFLPFRILTGFYVEEPWASVAFASAGVFVMVVLLRRVRARYFPRASGAVVMGCALVLGLGTMMPSVLRRPGVWEVPITAAHALGMLSLLAIFEALHARRSGVWLGLASAAMAMAVGARPVYLFGCGALLAPLLLRARAGAWRGAEWRRQAGAVFGPLLLIGGAIAWYNFARFDNPLEFGQRHQLNFDGAEPVTFSLRFVGYNAWLYALSAAGWSPFFPYVTVISAPAAPLGYVGIEDPFGVLRNVPFIFVMAGLLLVFRRGGSDRLRCWIMAVAALAVGCLATLLPFTGCTNRYMLDFVPGLLVLACTGWLVLVTRPWWQGGWRLLGSVVVAGAALHAAVFGVLVSLQHNTLLRSNHAGLYARIAHAANHLGQTYDRLAGVEYGPVELKVVFEKIEVGAIEPLVATGRSIYSDYLYVHYLGPDLVRFCFEHTGYGGFTGEPVRITPGREHTLLVSMGSLYPPEAHPYFDGMPEMQRRLRQRTLSVVLDGVEVLNRKPVFYDGTAHSPDLGSARERPAFRREFQGRILSARRVPEAAPTVSGRRYGTVRLEVVLPEFKRVRSEPLVCSGETGKGDLVYVKYLNDRSVLFGYDHWGVGGFETAPIAVEPGGEHIMEIDYGSLHPPTDAPAARVVIRMDGKTVADRAGGFYPCAPEQVKIGSNPIGASTATEEFTGKVWAAWRVDAKR